MKNDNEVTSNTEARVDIKVRQLNDSLDRVAPHDLLTDKQNKQAWLYFVKRDLVFVTL
jgi:hypothetical protein